MRKLTAGLVVLAAAAALGAGGAGAQTQCPGSPAVDCPIDVPQVGGIQQERPAPPQGGIQQERPAPPQVAADDQVSQPNTPTVEVESAAPRDVAGRASLPVTGADVTILAAAGASLIGGGTGLVLRARHLDARRR